MIFYLIVCVCDGYGFVNVRGAWGGNDFGDEGLSGLVVDSCFASIVFCMCLRLASAFPVHPADALS